MGIGKIVVLRIGDLQKVGREVRKEFFRFLFFRGREFAFPGKKSAKRDLLMMPYAIPDEAARWRLEFFGDQGRLMGESVIGQVDGGTLDALFLGPQGGYDAVQNVKQVKGEHIDVEFGNLYQREIESFCRSLLTGAPLEAPASDALQVQRVLEAAYLSNETGRIITL